MRVLVVRTSSMGDIIHTLPALTDAQRMIPGITFDWVAEENFTEIPSWHPAVDQVIPIALRRWKKSLFSQQTKQQWQQYKQALQAEKYDAIIDSQGLLKSVLLTANVANGPTHGFDWANAREPVASVFYQNRHQVSKKLHAVERARHMFAAALGYKVPQQMGDYGLAGAFSQWNAAEDDLDNGYVVCFHGTTWDTKHYPENYWREIISWLGKQGIKVKLPWGAPHEQLRSKRLAEGFDHVDIPDRMPIADVAKMLAGARAVVSVDTGLSHLAAALDCPNVVLFGPTDPGLVGGYGKNQVCLKASDFADEAVGIPKADPEVFTHLVAKIVINNIQDVL